MLLLKSIQTFFIVMSQVNKKWAARLAIELLFRPRRSRRSSSEEKFWQSGVELTFQSGCTGRIFGDINSKNVICIVHGWQSQGSRFKKLISDFTERGYKVITWNGPGHGESPGNRTNLAAFSRILFADLKALNISFYALVGHSFGAAACAFICRLGLDVKKLVLISGPTSAYGVFERYWNFIKLGATARPLFIEYVETEVQIKVDEMSVEKYAHELKQDILIVHDTSDQVVPFSDIENLKKLNLALSYHETNKLGHHRIISDDIVKTTIGNFLTPAPIEFTTVN